MKLKRQPFRDATFKPDGPGIFLPIMTFAQGNDRMHWAQKAAIVKKQRDATTMRLLDARGKGLIPPVFGDGLSVKLIRYSPGRLDGYDNLRSGGKAIIDAIARFYGVDDGDSRWRFEDPEQVKTKRGQHGVRLVISQTLPSCPGCHPSKISNPGTTHSFGTIEHPKKEESK